MISVWPITQRSRHRSNPVYPSYPYILGHRGRASVGARCRIALMVTPFLRSLEVSLRARKLFEEDSIFLITCVVSCTLNLVEAAGVEPASEIVVNKETPCSVAFRKVSRCALRTDKMRTLLVRGSRSCGPYPATETSLLCDVLPQPTGEAAEDGYLVN